MNMFEFLKIHQQKLAMAMGYALVFLLAFGLGRITVTLPVPPEIKVEEPADLSQSNDSAEVMGAQSAGEGAQTGGANPQNGQCAGKIKGNIGSSGKIYHMPGGAFYDRTQAEACFATEEQAKAAGFRKSSR
jgi:hypothetical protein